MKNNIIINNFSDLEREEIRVKKRIKKNEEEIKKRIKLLPEEIIKLGLKKAVVSVLNGNLFNSIFSIITTVGNALSENKKEEKNKEGVLKLIKIIINKLSNK